MTRSKDSDISSPPIALIYTRVSSEEQAREGVSLDAQLTECRRYAAQHGWMLGPEFQDVLSACDLTQADGVATPGDSDGM